MNTEKLRESAIDGMVMDKAHEDMGIYCKSVVGGSNPYEERTPYMEGWNDYSSALWKKSGIIQAWLNELDTEIKTDIEDYLLSEKLHISVKDEKVSLWVCCNDLFWWACADGEDFNFSDLSDFKKAMQESPGQGDILWCCRKRNMRPQTLYYKYFTDEEKALFNACGPERTDA